ncbi:MAG: DNA-binding protein HU-beta [Nitrospirae bacterium]|nr:MAG: DNA-binding protein HU-beta [Nitrospirota bacterium]
MNTKKLVNEVARISGIKKAGIGHIINTAIYLVYTTLSSGEDVKLAGLGVFKIKKTKARTGRNPKTGEAVQIPAKKKVTFTAAKFLKSLIMKGGKKDGTD